MPFLNRLNQTIQIKFMTKTINPDSRILEESVIPIIYEAYAGVRPAVKDATNNTGNYAQGDIEVHILFRQEIFNQYFIEGRSGVVRYKDVNFDIDSMDVVGREIGLRMMCVRSAN